MGHQDVGLLVLQGLVVGPEDGRPVPERDAVPDRTGTGRLAPGQCLGQVFRGMVGRLATVQALVSDTWIKHSTQARDAQIPEGDHAAVEVKIHELSI